ncbi:hypothetical protein F66182_14792, partial [Fusarium sp. NRRL 66182]
TTPTDPIEPAETVSPADPPPPAPIRSRRSRVSAPVYNLVQLSGTAGHGKRRAKGDIVADRRRRRTVSGPVSVDNNKAAPTLAQGATPESVRSGIDALDVAQLASKLESPRTRRQKVLEETVSSRRSSTRFSTAITPIATPLSNKSSKVSKRGRKSMDKAQIPMSRELRRLQDTKEFAGIDEKPVKYTVWSNGKYVDPKAPEPPATKKSEPEPTTKESKEAEPE